MEKNLKYLFVAIFAFCLSTATFAADCSSSTLRIPSQHGGFKVGIDALYLRSTSSDSEYATLFPPTIIQDYSLGETRSQVIDPSYDWGLHAQVGYLFPCTGNDVTIGYTYLKTNDGNSVVVGVPPDIRSFITVLPLSIIGGVNLLPQLATFRSAEGKLEHELSVVDLEAAQRFTTGAYDMRMFAGLRYANIDSSLNTFAYSFTRRGAQDFQSQFRGLGPRIGVDARYCLSSGFGLDADVSTSLLVGQMDSRYDLSAVVDSIFAPRLSDEFTSRNGSNTCVVPVLEAKLGGDYTYIVDCRCKSTLVLEAGYQVTNYFNASDLRMRVLNPRNAALLSPGDQNDIAFDGPYLGVKYCT